MTLPVEALKPFVQIGEYLQKRKFFRGFNPRFGFPVHKQIINDAIDPQVFVDTITEDMKDNLIFLRRFRNPSKEDFLDSFATKVAKVDLTLKYDPLTHYDNAYIPEAYERMQTKINSGDLQELAEGLHALADFYSHTSYPYFVRRDANGNIPNFSKVVEERPDDPEYLGQFNIIPNYTTEGYSFSRFSTNENLYEGKIEDAMKFWDRKIISGRFGQAHDSQNMLEMTQFCPEIGIDFKMRGALPHHNEIAVDDDINIAAGEHKPKMHILYDTDQAYADEHNKRVAAAIEHTRTVFASWQPKNN